MIVSASDRPFFFRNFSLLSFGDEAEEDEEDNNEAVESHFRGKSKSAHDLLQNDPKLVKQVDPSVIVATMKREPGESVAQVEAVERENESRREVKKGKLKEEITILSDSESDKGADFESDDQNLKAKKL